MNAVVTAQNAAPKPPTLADSLREATQELHTRAERTGLINDVLRGQASISDYTLFLRSMLAVYEALEAGLERHRGLPALGLLAQPVVYRSAALAADLTALHGSDWFDALPVVATGRDYAARIAAVAEDDPTRLVAHAYVRYLGDLNGGQVLKRLLARALGLAPSMLGFYDFAEIGDLPNFRTAYRDAFDAAGAQIQDFDALRDEAILAFRLNIALSEGLKPKASASA